MKTKRTLGMKKKENKPENIFKLPQTSGIHPHVEYRVKFHSLHL